MVHKQSKKSNVLKTKNFQSWASFSPKKLFICFESQRKAFRGEEKADRMKFFRQEAIRKKASKQKSLQKESKFSRREVYRVKV